MRAIFVRCNVPSIQIHVICQLLLTVIDNFTTKLVLNVELTAFIRYDTDCIPYVKDHRGTFLAKDH
jgi:hypothetical protein